MYSIGKTYKFRMSDSIVFTGTIVEEDPLNLRLDTIKGENVVLLKADILRSTELRGTDDGYS